jgi:RNA polymerase sigma-70 factor (ECF subfamily)
VKARIRRDFEREITPDLIDYLHKNIVTMIPQHRLLLEIDDLVQEVLIQAFKSFASFRGESAFRTWITRILRNVVLMKMRMGKAGSRIRSELMDSYSLEEDVPIADHRFQTNPERILRFKQWMEEAERACSHLSPHFSEVLRHILSSDLDELQPDMAEELKLNKETLRTRIFYARKELRQEMDPELLTSI